MLELNTTTMSGLAVSDQNTLASESHRETIPDGKPWFTDEEIEFVLSEVPAVLRGQLSNGPWTARFEQTVAAAAGTRHAVAFPSCTASLEAALMALRIGPGDEVLVPTQTFIATGMAVHLVGAKPVFCDIVAETHCLDPNEIVRKAGPRTKAVILVHMGGLITPHIREILRHCEARGLPLIEDCAHAHGAHWQGRPAGSIGAAGCFSYYPTKIITSGEGGALTTNDEALAATARSLQNRGRDMAASTELYTLSGRNNRFPEISALLGVAQYRRLEELLQARNELAAYYRRRLLAEAPQVTIQAQPEAGRHSYWKFLANLPSGYSRQRMQAHMQDRNVPLSWSYHPPLHSQPVFAALFNPAEAGCPVANELLERNVCLPIHPRITLRQRELVIDSFVEALQLEESRAMTVTIHQPSYLVWPPLLEKMARADLFIYLDDVEYSKNSEINRNRVLSGQGPQWLTVPVNTSSRTLIRDVQVADERWAAKHWKTVLQCYSKAPFFGAAQRESMQELYAGTRRSLLEMNLAFTEWLRKQTGVSTPAILSSELGVTTTSSRRILDLCLAVGAKRYLSGAAGLDYLNLAEFDEAGVDVLVQNYQHRAYSQQFHLPEFVPRLSAIDMFFNLGPATLPEIQTRGEWVPVEVAVAH